MHDLYGTDPTQNIFCEIIQIITAPTLQHQLDPTDQESAFKDLDHEVETVDVSVRGVKYLELEWNLVFFFALLY